MLDLGNDSFLCKPSSPFATLERVPALATLPFMLDPLPPMLLPQLRLRTPDELSPWTEWVLKGSFFRTGGSDPEWLRCFWGSCW